MNNLHNWSPLKTLIFVACQGVTKHMIVTTKILIIIRDITILDCHVKSIAARLEIRKR